MANETDKKLLQETERAFDKSSVLILELTEEIKEVEIKFGSSSSITIKKKNQLDTVRHLHDKTLTYINYLRDINENMYSSLVFNELERFSISTSLPMSKLVELAGGDPGRWKKLDKLNFVIEEMRQAVGIDEWSVDAFILKWGGKL
jgi:hypothetical protein